MNRLRIKTILIVDDDLPLANAMQKLMVRNGFIVHAARNGRFALDVLVKERVDLVITDIFMEGMDGLETVVAVKEMFPDINLIAMSGGSRYVGIDCLELAQKLGAHKILRKPVMLDTLLETIQELDQMILETAPNPSAGGVLADIAARSPDKLN